MSRLGRLLLLSLLVYAVQGQIGYAARSGRGSSVWGRGGGGSVWGRGGGGSMPGPPGSPENDGKEGIPGPPGEVGPAGPIGNPGNDGKNGENGNPGPPGEVGPAGPIGIPGNDGKDGQTGNPGLPGEVGPAGPIGNPGNDGMYGPPGSPGSPGNNGVDGKDGQDGNPGPPGEIGPAGPPGAPGVNSGKSCPTLVSISMPEAGCFEHEFDCNPLPGGSTTTSFLCPDGFLASREQGSNEWRHENIPSGTCDVGEASWQFPGFSEHRLYACLSDSNDCGFSETQCPSNFFCHGSTATEISKKPKQIACTNKHLFQLHTASGALNDPQTCTKGLWNGNGHWHLDVFCGYRCDSSCAFKKDATHSAPDFVDPPRLSEPDDKHTCPWTQCTDGGIFAWNGVKYERIPFKKAQCAAAGDPNLPWVIGSERYASIQCFTGTA